MWRSLLLGVVLAGVLAATALAKDPWDPNTKINKTDQAAAAATVLTKADLGQGWAGGARKPISMKAPTCPAQRPNDGDLTVVAHAESVFNNGNGGIQIDSDVEMFPNAKQAVARFNRFVQPKLFACLRYDLSKSLAGAANVTYLKGKRLDFAKVAERTAAFRVPIALKSGGQTVVVYSDFLYFGLGRTQIYVNIIAPSIQEKQLPGFELRLAKLLVKRAPH
jgi:hypothetical protein